MLWKLQMRSALQERRPPLMHVRAATTYIHSPSALLFAQTLSHTGAGTLAAAANGADMEDPVVQRALELAETTHSALRTVSAQCASQGQKCPQKGWLQNLLLTNG